MKRLATRVRLAADELDASSAPVTERAIIERLAPTLSAIEREALVRVGFAIAIRDALTKPKRRRRRATSEAVSTAPGEKLADQAAECRAWGDRERAS